MAAMGYSSLLICLSVYSESAHLAAIVLRFQHRSTVFKVADFDVKASLLNKSKQS